MRYLPDSSEMKQMDAHTINMIGIPSLVLMEHAAANVVYSLEGCLDGQSSILVLCGSGNNGADGLAAARMLSHKGFNVKIAVIGNEAHATDEWKVQRNICANMKIEEYCGDMTGEALAGSGFTVLIDSLFGTGLSRDVGGIYAQAIKAINDSGIFTVSVDIPSGLSSDDGHVLGCAVRASLTVAIQHEKLGMALFPGREYCGKTVVRDIGITKESEKTVSPRAFTLDGSDLSRLPARPVYSNKGTFGKLLIVAGSKNMAGAAYLSAIAAYRSGAGLVKVMTVESNRTIIQQLVPEAILTTYPCDEFPAEELESSMAWATAIVAGPGLGVGDTSYAIIEYLTARSKVPLLLDADALNIIAMHPELKERLTDRMIVTPHLGEMSRLIGSPIKEIQSDLAGCASSFTDKYGVVTVLKDARTIISLPDGKLYVNTCGNSGMATGGSGDVLSGAIGGLLAEGLSASDASVYGVLRHSLAGDKAASEIGERAMIARDIAGRLS